MHVKAIQVKPERFTARSCICLRFRADRVTGHKSKLNHRASTLITRVAAFLRASLLDEVSCASAHNRVTNESTQRRSVSPMRGLTGA